MFQLCSFKYPYKSSKWPKIFEEIVSESLFPRIPDSYSEELNEIIQSMLVRNPFKRPSTEKLLSNPYLKNAAQYFASIDPQFANLMS